VQVGPACSRMIASPPIQLPPVLNVLPVTTNMLVPSLATPPCPQISPPMALVAQAVTLEGLFDGRAHNPAMKCATIAEVTGIRHVNHTIHEPECGALVLDRRSK